MAHRPYPNARRALNQLDRHYPGPPLMRVGRIDIAMRPASSRIASPTGAYVLSTRRTPDYPAGSR
ncbi:hypothetical protein AB0D49_08340 [Streptomyces sp. NPDC048290]|uniref:hypothetical protein n=1 Tax=Streptomyces sp. NPDC048290 TaxID=3155811 RepID=UPI00343848C5